MNPNESLFSSSLIGGCAHTLSTLGREAHDTSLRAGFGLNAKGTVVLNPLSAVWGVWVWVVVVNAFGLSSRFWLSFMPGNETGKEKVHNVFEAKTFPFTYSDHWLHCYRIVAEFIYPTLWFISSDALLYKVFDGAYYYYHKNPVVVWCKCTFVPRRR